jgi:hypothetical protein
VLDGPVDPLATPLRSPCDPAGGFETAQAAFLQYSLGKGTCGVGNHEDRAGETTG